ncbi:hypothetical protein [Geotalea sp. SG265]|uniref:hypothetical protein n=1 Tax=Geotalea sp. SG265 TaxID=2922867 RepID=UPI001FAF3DB2|nr:hypothetical protein [Geotalea sp. SG265]
MLLFIKAKNILRYLFPLRLNRYSYLLDKCEAASPEHRFILNLRQQEIFRLCSGFYTNPVKASFIMDLYERGVFRMSELKRMNTYFEVHEMKAVGNFRNVDILAAVCSFIIGLIITLLFTIIGINLLNSKQLYQMWLFFSGSIVYCLIIFIVGEPFRTVFLYAKFKKALISLNLWQPVGEKEGAPVVV